MINDLRMDGDALFSESLYIYIYVTCVFREGKLSRQKGDKMTEHNLSH